MCFGVVIRQTLYGFVDVSHSFLVLALNLPLRNNLALVLLLNELIDRLLFLLLETLQLSLAIVEDLLDLWIQVLQILFKLPLHQ